MPKTDRVLPPAKADLAGLPRPSARLRQADDADVAELVDARDLKSLGGRPPCRFESGRPHQ